MQTQVARVPKYKGWAFFGLIFLVNAASFYAYATWLEVDPVERAGLIHVEGIVKSVRDVSDVKDRGKHVLHFIIQRDDGGVTSFDTRSWNFDRFEAEPLAGKRASALFTPGAGLAYDLEVEGRRIIEFEKSYSEQKESRQSLFFIGRIMLMIAALCGAMGAYHYVRRKSA